MRRPRRSAGRRRRPRTRSEAACTTEYRGEPTVFALPVFADAPRRPTGASAPAGAHPFTAPGAPPPPAEPPIGVAPQGRRLKTRFSVVGATLAVGFLIAWIWGFVAPVVGWLGGR